MTNAAHLSGNQPAEHAHRWRIEGQGSATSAATCACGATREFQNGWNRETSIWASSRRAPGDRSKNN